MLLTVLEIIVFMAAAAVVGVALGWVLRGTLGREQEEISDLRAQLRKLKKARRESEAASKAEKAVSDTTVTVVSSAPAEVESKTEQAQKLTGKKTAARKSGRSSARKTQAEREADREAGKAAFVAVIGRIGRSDRQDKLTRIYGIGKRYESMLNELGITSFEQVAKLEEEDLKTLSAALGVLDDRLFTEDWVGSARKLMQEATE